jgi:hypothetical protein
MRKRRRRGRKRKLNAETLRTLRSTEEESGAGEVSLWP